MNTNTHTSDTELELYVTLFEAGNELTKQYQRYQGDKDWIEWLRETLPKTGLSVYLDTYATNLATLRAIEEQRGLLNDLNKTLFHSTPQPSGQFIKDTLMARLDDLAELQATLKETKND